MPVSVPARITVRHDLFGPERTNAGTRVNPSAALNYLRATPNSAGLCCHRTSNEPTTMRRATISRPQRGVPRKPRHVGLDNIPKFNPGALLSRTAQIPLGFNDRRASQQE
ncbi:hypothetical protein FRC07_002504 [Ceratobasidium sp. 392]|nr:hypothetical protein FRC07_002504 [Ceratobasidium sp. 392]